MSKKKKPKKEEKPSLLICDTNVVVLMYLFKESKMFDATYKYGKVKIHPSVIGQIQGWIDRNNKKCKKFGKPLLKSIIAKCRNYTDDIKEPTQAQYDRSIRMLEKIEDQLNDSDKSMAADNVDQGLLILAYVNKAHLATQEKTMTSVGQKSLSKDRIVRFEHLVIDLVSSGIQTKEEIDAGLHSLAHYKESLDSSLRTQMLQLAQKKTF